MQSADGQYGYDRPWQLFAESLATQRMDNNGPSWYPDITPVQPPMLWQDAGEFIRETEVPPRWGWKPYNEGQATIEDILDNVFSRLQDNNVMATKSDDWSGVQGGYQATQRPSGAGGMAVT